MDTELTCTAPGSVHQGDVLTIDYGAPEPKVLCYMHALMGGWTA